MSKKMFWGLGALIAFVIAAGGFIYWQWSTVQQLEKQAAQFEEMIEKIDKPVAANEPPPAAPGKKWVPHGDHFHEVPIDAPDVWQGEPHSPVAKDVQAFEAEPAQAPLPRKEGVYKKGINGQMLYYPPHPPFETYKHLLKDPEATIRKNAAIIVANYGTPEASRAYKELNLLDLAIHKGYVGGSMWSDEVMKLLDLKEEVLWKPLAKAGHIVRTPVPVTVEGGETE